MEPSYPSVIISSAQQTMAPRKESCFPSSSKQCCFVCESPHGASPHFGTVSCLACAAFFRRTVSLNISFQCKSKAKGTCRIFHELRMICRSCRYDKCIKAGMQRTCVQKRRDMDIIMRSRSAARQSMTQLEIYSNTSSEDSPEIERCRSSESVSQEPFSPEVDVKPQIDHFMIETENSSSQRILDFYIQQDNKAMDRRRVMFGNEDIGSLVDDRGGIPFTRESLVPYTVKAHHTYIRFDHVLTLEFLKALPGFSKLEKSDRLSLYRYWILGISSVDSSFITSQMGLVDENLLVLTNGTYLSAKDTSIGYDGEDDMSSEEKEKLFWPMYNLLNHKLTRPMHRLKVNQIEFVAMKALSIWQAVYFELSAEGKRMAKQHQTAIIEGLHDYYKDKPDGETRMGNIILFIGSLFDVYKIIIDNYRQFEVFNLVKLDVFSRQLLCM